MQKLVYGTSRFLTLQNIGLMLMTVKMQIDIVH